MNIVKPMLLVLGVVVLACSAASPSAAQIIPCSMDKSTNSATDAGIRCRQKNIDKYASSLRNVYNSATLDTCLQKMSDELQGRIKHNGKAKRGFGKFYYAKLNECSRQAERRGLKFGVNSATSSDDDNDSAPPADCDSGCAADRIRQFMQDTPELEEDDD